MGQPEPCLIRDDTPQNAHPEHMATFGGSNHRTTLVRGSCWSCAPRAPLSARAREKSSPGSTQVWFAALAHTHTHLAGASRHNRRDPAWHRRHACEEQRPYRPQCYVPPVPLRFGRLPHALLPRAIDDGRRGRRVERSDTVAQPDAAAVVPLATHERMSLPPPFGYTLYYPMRNGFIP